MTSFTATASTTPRAASSAAFRAATTGRRNCTVFGVEVEYSWGSFEASSLDTDGDPGAALDQLSVSSRFRGIRHGQGAHRRRGGQSSPLRDRRLRVRQLQPVDIRSSTIGGGDNETFEHRRTRWGWVAGFGTEWAINQNWSIKSEVNYARFERDETFVPLRRSSALRTGRSASRTRTRSGPPRSASTTGSAGTHRSSRSTETCSSTVERCEGPGRTPGPFIFASGPRPCAHPRLWRRPSKFSFPGDCCGRVTAYSASQG